MIRISTRMWAGVLALSLLPVFSSASDKNGSDNASSTASKAASASESSAPASTTAPSAAPAASSAVAGDPLLRLMVAQGLLTAADVAKLAGVPSSELRDRLLILLLMKNKNALSSEDVNALKAPSEAAASAAAGESSASSSSTDLALTDQQNPPQLAQTPPPAGPIPAVAPIRVLQIDPPKREGVVPVLNIGKKVSIQPYGLFKASSLYDTSSPYGNDFPLPGFNPITNGPNNMPEYHVKARFARFGANFEWMDSPHIIVTGKVEADFEGNFSRVNNRNISSIRSNMFQLRQAYVRIDYKPSDQNSVFALFGQDWTPFASSTLPNLFETTGLGVGFGTLYERDPQFRFGYEHNFGSWKLSPEFAIVLPAYGNLPADITAAGAVVPNNEGIGNQLGYGERQGVDSATPEIQGRVVFQFQLDHAPGVAPAQLIVSGVHGDRTQMILSTGVPAAFATDFPKGATVSSPRNALTGEFQFPTRWFTLVGKYYNGTDLRYYFASQIYSEYNVTTGLTGTATGNSIDGSGPTPVFGCIGGGLPPACAGGAAVIARQVPPRAWGGFLNLGLPLSRWFNANPAGHNAGWQMFFHYGLDQVRTADVIHEGGGRAKGRLAAGTLYYKLNNFVGFGWEESLYTTVAIPLTATGLFPAFNGRPQREWNDFRSEIGPIFTF
jgi:hypothetical protein